MGIFGNLNIKYYIKAMKIKVKYFTPIINHPDYQGRIYKRDSNINWSGKVHEKVEGYKTISYLPQDEEWSLYHPKNIEKQEKQNDFYNKIQ